MQDTVNMLSTPTRRNRFMLGSNQSHMTDDSPILSQETINISWKWNNEGTPIRPTNKTSKLRRSITNNSPQLHHIQRSSKRNSNDNQNGSTTISPKLLAEPETHSPKGLYKFQEEMRKIQFDIESDTSCDNTNGINNDKSEGEDTGYPPNDIQTNASSCNRLDETVHMLDNEPTKSIASINKFGMDDSFADDLLNDSDFDQILLTCKIPAQNEPTQSEANQLRVQQKANSAPEIKTDDNINNSNESNWNLTEDDCFDDLVKDFDADIPCSLNTSAKFTRHKSMPQQQQPQHPSTSNIKKFVPQQSYVNSSINRKSFTRHESMPITNHTMNRPSGTRSNSGVWRFSPISLFFFEICKFCHQIKSI